MSASPTQTVTVNADGSKTIYVAPGGNLPGDTWPAYLAGSQGLGIDMDDKSYVRNSMGVNVPQVIVAGIENAIASKGNMKNSLLMAGAVGVSNLLPAYGPAGMWGSNAEKYLAEPVVAGILYAAGTKFITSSGAKEGSSVLAKFAKGFVIGASSAAVGGAIVSTTIAPVRIQSQYSAGARGLRGQSNINPSSGYRGAVIVS